MKVTITPEENKKVERLFYLHMSNLNTLNYILSQNDVPIERIEKFNEATGNIYMELEKEKEQITTKYAPDTPFNRYIFLFNECAIEYTNE